MLPRKYGKERISGKSIEETIVWFWNVSSFRKFGRNSDWDRKLDTLKRDRMFFARETHITVSLSHNEYSYHEIHWVPHTTSLLTTNEHYFFLWKEHFWLAPMSIKHFGCNEYLVRGGSRIPRRRGRQPSKGGGAPTYDFAKFCKKLHEIEEILGRAGIPRRFFVS